MSQCETIRPFVKLPDRDQSIKIPQGKNLFVVDPQELRAIATTLRVSEVLIEWVTGIVVEGVPNFEQLLPGTRLHFYKSGVVPQNVMDEDVLLRIEQHHSLPFDCLRMITQQFCIRYFPEVDMPKCGFSVFAEQGGLLKPGMYVRVIEPVTG
jgi:hypothetical protein